MQATLPPAIATSRAEATATTFFAAIHDQITVPASCGWRPGPGPTSHHEVAIFAVVVRFALLDRPAFAAAVPLSLMFMGVLAIHG